MQLLRHDIFTNDVLYLELALDLRPLPPHLLPLLPLFCRCAHAFLLCLHMCKASCVASGIERIDLQCRTWWAFALCPSRRLPDDLL